MHSNQLICTCVALPLLLFLIDPPRKTVVVGWWAETEDYDVIFFFAVNDIQYMHCTQKKKDTLSSVHSVEAQ